MATWLTTGLVALPTFHLVPIFSDGPMLRAPDASGAASISQSAEDPP